MTSLKHMNIHCLHSKVLKKGTNQLEFNQQSNFIDFYALGLWNGVVFFKDFWLDIF